MHTNCFAGNLMGWDHWGDLDIDQRITLQLFWGSWVMRLWSGLNWFTVVSHGVLLWWQWCIYGFCDMKGFIVHVNNYLMPSVTKYTPVYTRLYKFCDKIIDKIQNSFHKGISCADGYFLF